MRIVLLFLFAGCCCWAQERAELGWYVDRAGALRRLEGVSGAPQAGPPVAYGVRSFARGAGWLAWTTESEFCVLADGGAEPACRGAEAAYKLMRFTPAGFPLLGWTGARFDTLAAPDAAWKECLACPPGGDGVLDFEMDARGALRLLTEAEAGLRITRYDKAGVWLGEEFLEGVRAPALLEPEGWVAVSSEGLAGHAGWRWDGPIPGTLMRGSRGVWIAWDEEGPALLASERKQVSRIAAEDRQ